MLISTALEKKKIKLKKVFLQVIVVASCIYLHHVFTKQDASQRITTNVHEV
jgi:hypothetical protein